MCTIINRSFINRNCQTMFIFFKQGFRVLPTQHYVIFLVIYNNIYFIQNSRLGQEETRRARMNFFSWASLSTQAAASPVWALPGHVPGHRLGEPAYHPGHWL